MIIKVQVRMCNTTQKVRRIATLSERLLSSSYALLPIALHHVSHIKFIFPFLTSSTTRPLHRAILFHHQYPSLLDQYNLAGIQCIILLFGIFLDLNNPRLLGQTFGISHAVTFAYKVFIWNRD